MAEVPVSNRVLAANAKVLMIGTGGIGCELIKCLAQAGFKNVDMVDMDTIEISNLNRQFLFRKEHVGKPKVEVAKDSIMKRYPHMNIKTYCKSIIDDDFCVSWFRQYDFVVDALDNVIARTHVNRMCLAAEVPLIDTGTSGFQGQVEVVIKGMTKCYECEPKSHPKTYPNCTIRNTPSEPIHCIVWAKNLFLQLFGEADDEAEVSPDTADPELAGSSADNALIVVSEETGLTKRVSTRAWAKQCDYDPYSLFDKFFFEDIRYLLSLKDLWTTRKPPTPLKWVDGPLTNFNGCKDKEPETYAISDQKLWSLKDCIDVFKTSCNNLKKRFLTSLQEQEGVLHWDKDDKDAMDFVAACANIRSHVFSIEPKTRYDIKSMAGNIVPAVATANAMVAGLVVFQAYLLLQKQPEKIRTIYMRAEPNLIGHFLHPEKNLSAPYKTCYICSFNPEITLEVDVKSMTVSQLHEEVFKKHFKMVQPEVMVQSAGTVIISDDCDFDDKFLNKKLVEFGIRDGSVLLADDFLQTCKFFVRIREKVITEGDNDASLFQVFVNSEIKTTPDQVAENGSKKINGANGDLDVDSDDDIMVIEEGTTKPRVRSHTQLSDDEDDVPSKKAKINE